MPFDFAKAREFLLLLDDCLTAVGVPFFLMQGTCLGAYRDGGFTPTELDIDLGFLMEEFRAGDVCRSLLRNGVEVHTWMRHDERGRCHTVVARKGPVKADLVAWRVHGGDRYATAPDDVTPHYCIVHPRDRIEKYEKVSLFGRTWDVPCPVEGYLEAEYGPDWRTPREDHVSRVRVYNYLEWKGIPRA